MLITIDGCSGVGKTTLADYLVDRHGFTEIGFNRQFCRHLDAIALRGNKVKEHPVIKATTAFSAFRESTDVERAMTGRFVCDHFWEPTFMGLYLDHVIHGNDMFLALAHTFDHFMTGFFVSRPVLSIWLDAPYGTCCRRAEQRDGKPAKPQIEEVDCWRNFAIELGAAFSYFKVIDATGPAESIRRKVAAMLEGV